MHVADRLQCVVEPAFPPPPPPYRAPGPPYADGGAPYRSLPTLPYLSLPYRSPPGGGAPPPTAECWNRH